MKNQLIFVQAMDALFPIGSYTMSNGMETYVQKQIVVNESSLLQFLRNYLRALTYADLGFAAQVAAGGDVSELSYLCGSSKSPRELREGSMKLCSRFLKAQEYLGEFELLREYQRGIQEKYCEAHYCIAVGLLIRETGIDMAEGLSLYAYSQLSSMVNHAVKLIPLRQLEGQRALKEASKEIEKVVNLAINADQMLLGATGPGFDYRSMEHEVLFTRMYLS